MSPKSSIAIILSLLNNAILLNENTNTNQKLAKIITDDYNNYLMNFDKEIEKLYPEKIDKINQKYKNKEMKIKNLLKFHKNSI